MAQPRFTDKKETVTFKYAHSKSGGGCCSAVFHPFYEVCFFLKGNAEFVCESIRKKLKPLDIVLIPAGEYHQFILSENGEENESIVLNIHPSLLGDEVLKEAFFNKKILRLDENNRIIKHLLYLKDAQQTLSEQDFKIILPAVATDIVFLIKQAENPLLFEERGLQRLSVEIMKYINANYKGTINLQKIAEEFFISVSTACHYFKEDFSISIKQYIIEKKMNDARILIESGHRTQEVCVKLGFENYSTFFRAYKKRFGISPKGKE